MMVTMMAMITVSTMMVVVMTNDTSNVVTEAVMKVTTMIVIMVMAMIVMLVVLLMTATLPGVHFDQVNFFTPFFTDGEMEVSQGEVIFSKAFN